MRCVAITALVGCLMGCGTGAAPRAALERPSVTAEPTVAVEPTPAAERSEAVSTEVASTSAQEERPPRARTLLELLAGTDEERCAVLFSGHGARLALSSPPQNVVDPEGPFVCFEGPYRGCPPNHTCQSGRAGRTRIVLASFDPSEAGHEVPVMLLVTSPLRGFCGVLPRPVVRLASGPGGAMGVRDLDGDGRAELLWPHEVTIWSDRNETIAELVVLHPYALEETELVLRPALAAAHYARQVEHREASLEQAVRDCEASGDAGALAACAARNDAERLLIDALRHAASCEGS